MRSHLASNVLKVVVLSILCVLTTRAVAQDKPKAPDDMKTLAAKPTPKTADGHPDLTGHWLTANELRDAGAERNFSGNVRELVFGNKLPGVNLDTDIVTTDNHANGETRRKSREALAKPEYKPEFQAKVEAGGKDPNHMDPTLYSCLPAGVPRMGAPAMIVQHPGFVVFLYSQTNTAAYSTFRVIPTDGRAHRTGNDYDPNPFGDPVGRWEGDTLVVETTGFDDSTWFGQDGYFHTDAMKVTERFTRKGNTLEYSSTVEDPKVLVKPFSANPVTLGLRDPKDLVYNGDYPCDITKHNFRDHADHENHI